MKKAYSKKTKRLARAAGGSLTDRFNSYLNIHAHALFFSLARLLKSPFTSAMTVGVLAIAIALAGGFYITIVNLQELTGNLESSNNLSVFMKHNVTEQKAQHIADQLLEFTQITEVQMISRQNALEEFKQYSGFGEALNALQENPLPVVLLVSPVDNLNDKQQFKRLIAAIQQFSDVDFVQIDMQWLERLQSMMKLAKRAVLLISMVLACAVLFITGNTIRLELQNRREEVVISKMVGATHAFIQRPFLYSGFWYGMASGLLAWFFITLILLMLEQPVSNLSNLYGGGFALLFLSFSESMRLIGISALLGVVGAWLVLQAHLQQIKPE